MTIGVIGEFDRKGGGSYHQSKKIFKILSKFKDFKFKLLTINSQKKISKINDDNKIYYEINFIDQFFFLFYSSKLIKSILKKFNIKSRFEKFLKKNKIDLIFFLGCSRLSLFCNNINYVTYIYEFHHLSRPDLPEYKGWSDFDFREELLETNIKKSLSLIVDTQKKGKDLIKYYNCFEDKINVIPLTTSITELENKRETQNSKEIIDYIKKNKEFFFYPAQYWSHKNHYYILRALQQLKKKHNRSIQFVQNPNYAEGMTTSIRAGVQAASSGALGFMICLSDLPFIETAEYQELMDQFKLLLAENPQLILRPVVGDQPGNPVLFSASYREELLSHVKMEGCRGLIRQYKERVHRHPMNTDHVLRDIDTPEEYERYFVNQPA